MRSREIVFKHKLITHFGLQAGSISLSHRTHQAPSLAEAKIQLSILIKWQDPYRILQHNFAETSSTLFTYNYSPIKFFILAWWGLSIVSEISSHLETPGYLERCLFINFLRGNHRLISLPTIFYQVYHYE